MPVKRSTADIWFSKCIRERSDWICEFSKKDFKHNPGACHCSHFFGRRARIIRWDPMNAFCHGAYEHKYLGENPYLFQEHYLDVRGQGQLDLLLEKRNDIRIKITKKDEKEIGKHYKKEYETMQEQRNDGIKGWLEFTGWQ